MKRTLIVAMTVASLAMATPASAISWYTILPWLISKIGGSYGTNPSVMNGSSLVPGQMD